MNLQRDAVAYNSKVAELKFPHEGVAFEIVLAGTIAGLINQKPSSRNVATVKLRCVN